MLVFRVRIRALRYPSPTWFFPLPLQNTLPQGLTFFLNSYVEYRILLFAPNRTVASR